MFVGSDPDLSLFWCNNETAVSGQSLESCKNNVIYYYNIGIVNVLFVLKLVEGLTVRLAGRPTARCFRAAHFIPVLKLSLIWMLTSC